MESTAYDEDDETGEYAPQIVDLTPEQAKLLNITPDDARKLGLDLSKASLDDPAQQVVDSEDDSEIESDHEQVLGGRDEEEEEETQDLEDMDSRY